jgi:hypothetical protein
MGSRREAMGMRSCGATMVSVSVPKKKSLLLILHVPVMYISAD